MKVGYIALVGPTNAGKSTLMNTLLESKLSIVTSKPQTTRRSVEGIVTTDEGQVIFVDAPGYVAPTSGLNKFLGEEIEQRILGADAVLVCIPSQIHSGDRELIQKDVEVLKKTNKPYGVVITKSDLEATPADEEFLKELFPSSAPLVKVSAQKDPTRTRKEVLELSYSLLPESEHYLYPPDQWTTMNLREIAREVIREKGFELLEQEVPYGLGVRLLSFEEEEDIVRIQADILVPKAAHKRIVIGQGGQNLKRMGMGARKDLEKWLGKKVFLGLHVVVRKNWMDDEVHLRELGYVRSK